MRRLWVTEVPVAEIEVFTDGRAMQLGLPANMMFPGGRAVLRKDRRRFLADVAQVLAMEAPVSAMSWNCLSVQIGGLAKSLILRRIN